jgi:hypothetical protein
VNLRRSRAAATIALAVLAAGAAGCGSPDTGALRWVGRPQLLRDPSIPNDRVLRGRVRNNGVRTIELTARDLRLLDADGRRVPGVATFAVGFVHGLYPPTREPRLPAAEERRLGRKALLKPGQQAMLTLAWRLRPGKKPPVTVSYGPGQLGIPKAR